MSFPYSFRRTVSVLLSIYIALLTFIITTPTQALDQVWEMTVPGDYTVSDASQITLDGVVAKLAQQSPPLHAAALNHNATIKVHGGEQIHIEGNYAYISATYDNALEIVDISDLDNPIHAGALVDTAATALDYAGSIYVLGNYAYLTSLTEDGLEIVDVSNPTNPTHVGALFDTALTSLGGASGVVVTSTPTSTYAFVTAYDEDALAVIDVTDPTSPTQVAVVIDNGTFELNGANFIDIQGDYLYISGTADYGIEIIDISNPLIPIPVGRKADDTTTLLGKPYDLKAIGNYLYVISGTQHGMEILNINDPTNPTHAASILDDATMLLNDSIYLDIQGDYAYITTVYEDKSVSVIDISNPLVPIYAGDIVGPGSWMGFPVGIAVTGTHAYFVDRTGHTLSVLDITSTTPTYVTHLESDATLPFFRSTDVALYEHYAYISSQDNVITVLDMTDPYNPISVGRIDYGFNSWLNTLRIENNQLYVQAKDETDTTILSFYDLTSDPTNPDHMGTTTTTGSRKMEVQGNYAYLTDYNNDSMTVYDVSDPANMHIVGSIVDDGISLLDGAWGIAVDGNYAYVLGYSDKAVNIIDITNPANPTYLGAITDNATTLLSSPSDISIYGDLAYVTSYIDHGIEILDISDPSNPTHAGSFVDDGTTLLESPWSIDLLNTRIYTTNYYNGGVEVLDITNSTTPVHYGNIPDDGTTNLNYSYNIAAKNNSAVVTTYYGPDMAGIEILDIGDYSGRRPYVTANSAETFTTRIDSFTETLGAGNEGEVLYQLSTDGGVTWNYWDGSAWAVTTDTTGYEASSSTPINTNIGNLDTDGGDFVWRAYLVSNGFEAVELDQIEISYDNNHGPTDITLSHNTIAENQTIGTTVGILSTADMDVADVHTYTLGCAIPAGDETSFTISSDELKTTEKFDYETKHSYTICIKTNDGNGATFEKNFTVTVLDENDGGGSNIILYVPTITSPSGNTGTESASTSTQPTPQELPDIYKDEHDILHLRRLEGTYFVTKVEATATLGELSYSIYNGKDGDLFEVHPKSGEVYFRTPAVYNTPTDTDKNNVYEIMVRVDNNSYANDVYDIEEIYVTIIPQQAETPQNTEESPEETKQMSSTEITPIPEKVCEPYLTTYLRRDLENDPEEVRKLQTFLKYKEGYDAIEVTGIFDNTTHKKVIRFQEKYQEDILVPWNLKKGTGFVYITTSKKINALMAEKTCK